MSTLKAYNIEPATGTTLTLGTTGDSVTVSSDSLKLDTFKDAGGNTLFQSDGAGNVTNVNGALKAGGPTLLRTVDVITATSQIVFSNDLDNSYDVYMIVFTDISPATNSASFRFYTKDSSGAGTPNQTTTFFCAHHNESDASSLHYDDNGKDIANGGTSYLTEEQENNADSSSAGIFYIYQPWNTTYVKHFQSRFSNYNYNARSQDAYTSGYINDAGQSLTYLSFSFSSGNIRAGACAKLYGIG